MEHELNSKHIFAIPDDERKKIEKKCARGCSFLWGYSIYNLASTLHVFDFKEKELRVFLNGKQIACLPLSIPFYLDQKMVERICQLFKDSELYPNFNLDTFDISFSHQYPCNEKVYKLQYVEDSDGINEGDYIILDASQKEITQTDLWLEVLSYFKFNKRFFRSEKQYLLMDEYLRFKVYKIEHQLVFKVEFIGDKRSQHEQLDDCYITLYRSTDNVEAIYHLSNKEKYHENFNKIRELIDSLNTKLGEDNFPIYDQVKTNLLGFQPILNFKL
jgi:hypothetical protein|nr:MAG TPA: hypothetical protein [Bacteriophage sp.]